MSMFRLESISILNLDPMLEEIVLAIEEEFGIDVVTSAFRFNDSGVHGVLPPIKLRGIDFRCKSKYIGPIIVEWVSARWQYDSNRPHLECALFHNVGRGPHLHLQVHPNTIKIERKW